MSQSLFRNRKRRSWEPTVRALSHKATWAINKRLPEQIPLVFVVGYPKSGTTWVCQLLADYFQLPFPRASLLPIGCPAVVHGHEIVLPHYRTAAYVLRDGRDVMTSLYFHLTRRMSAGDRPPLTRRQKRMFPGLVNKDDVATNFPRFLEAQMRDPFASRYHWGEHVMRSLDALGGRVASTSYEALLADGRAELSRLAETIGGEPVDPDRVGWTIEKFSFSRQAGRRPGAEARKSFLRKGSAGDWRNHFTREAAEIFDDWCGDALIRAGYEADRSWVAGERDGAAS